MTDRIVKCVNEILGTSDTQVLPHLRLEQDLGMDSLDAIELVMCLEDEFDVEILDEDFERVVTVGDLYKLEVLVGKL